MSLASLNRCRGETKFHARKTIFASQACNETESEYVISRFMGVCRFVTLRVIFHGWLENPPVIVR